MEPDAAAPRRLGRCTAAGDGCAAQVEKKPSSLIIRIWLSGLCVVAAIAGCAQAINRQPDSVALGRLRPGRARFRAAALIGSPSTSSWPADHAPSRCQRSLRGADILALEEMDETGTDRIPGPCAQLRLLSRRHYPEHTYFGTAVLPLADRASGRCCRTTRVRGQPHRHRRRLRLRGRRIRVYAVHLSTLFGSRMLRATTK
jgi:hypothetical protein